MNRKIAWGKAEYHKTVVSTIFPKIALLSMGLLMYVCMYIRHEILSKSGQLPHNFKVDPMQFEVNLCNVKKCLWFLA